MNKNNKGFTLIELLVVVAIIGILSSVVLASLNNARGKGADAAIKSNLANIRAQAEMLYDDIGNYSTVCSNPTVTAMIDSAKSSAGVSGATNTTIGTTTTAVCRVGGSGSTDYWIASVPLKSSNVNAWCVDSSGSSKSTAVALPASATVCP